MLEKVVRKSISRPIIIYIMNLKRGRVLLLPVSVQTSESLLGEERRSLFFPNPPPTVCICNVICNVIGDF